MRHLVALLLVAAVLTACGESILTPATGPGTEYPCGIGGTCCAGSTADKPISCPHGFACFPVGAALQEWCEDVASSADDLTGVRRDGGAPRLIPATHSAR